MYFEIQTEKHDTSELEISKGKFILEKNGHQEIGAGLKSAWLFSTYGMNLDECQRAKPARLNF